MPRSKRGGGGGGGGGEGGGSDGDDARVMDVEALLSKVAAKVSAAEAGGEGDGGEGGVVPAYAGIGMVAGAVPEREPEGLGELVPIASLDVEVCACMPRVGGWRGRDWHARSPARALV